MTKLERVLLNRPNATRKIKRTSITSDVYYFDRNSRRQRECNFEVLQLNRYR